MSGWLEMDGWIFDMHRVHMTDRLSHQSRGRLEKGVLATGLLVSGYAYQIGTQQPGISTPISTSTATSTSTSTSTCVKWGRESRGLEWNSLQSRLMDWSTCSLAVQVSTVGRPKECNVYAAHTACPDGTGVGIGRAMSLFAGWVCIFNILLIINGQARPAETFN